MHYSPHRTKLAIVVGSYPHDMRARIRVLDIASRKLNEITL